MYDIDILEDKWRQYRHKRLIRISSFAIIIIAFLAVPIIYTTLKSSSKEDKKDVEKVVNSSSKSPIKTSINQTQNHIPSIVEVSKPSSSKSNKVEPKKPEKTPKMVIKLSDKKVNLLVASKDNNITTSKVDTLQVVPFDKNNSTKKKIILKVIDANTTTVIKNIESRFPETKDYDDAIYLAKYFYKRHNYKKASKWAMNANVVNSSSEESWLLYAKAKAKQGYRVQALKVLQNYYDRTNSESARVLIDQIRKGESF